MKCHLVYNLDLDRYSLRIAKSDKVIELILSEEQSRYLDDILKTDD